MRKISRNASFACCATAACDAPVIRRLGDFVSGGGGMRGAAIDAENVDRFHMAARDNMSFVAMAERGYNVKIAPKLHIDVYIGQAANDNIADRLAA
jgi:hypothetical protein